MIPPKRTMSLKSAIRLLILMLLVISCVSTSLAQHKITAIEMSTGVRPNSVTLNICEPRGEFHEVEVAKSKGLSFPSGTRYKIPKGIKLNFSYDGNKQTVGPSKEEDGMIYTFTFNPKGETHTVEGGPISNNVTSKEAKTIGHKLEYTYSVNMKGTKCITTGTEFTLTPGKEGHPIITTKTGSIDIIEKVEVNIKNKLISFNKNKYNTKFSKYKPDLTTSKKESHKAGEKKYIAGKPEVYTYNHYKGAIDTIKNKIAANGDGAHNEELAVDYILLGELYLHHNKKELAIKNLREAVKLLEYLHPHDLTTLEAELYLAEALIYYPNQKRRKDFVEDATYKEHKNEAIKILNKEIEELEKEATYDLDHSNTAQEVGDTKLQNQYCHDLFISYQLLAWANYMLTIAYEKDAIDPAKLKAANEDMIEYDGKSKSFDCQH
jgi:hypothetical protein